MVSEVSTANDLRQAKVKATTPCSEFRIRALIWLVLLALTAVILAYPVRLLCEYRSIQAPYIFDNLPLFAVLFCFWMALLLTLGMTKTDQAGETDWENLALACLFCVVFWGFWVIITPHGSYADDVFNQAHVTWLVKEGTIPTGHANLVYFDYPGMHLLVSTLSEVSGLSVAESRTFFLLTNTAVFTALLYILLQRVLESNRLSLLALVVIVLTDIVLVDKMHVFTPGCLGFTLLAGLLVLLVRSETGLLRAGAEDGLPLLLLFSALVVTYFANSLLIVLVLVGTAFAASLAHDTTHQRRLITISLFAVLVLAWAVYWTWHTFESLTGFLPSMKEQILSGGFMETALRLGTSNAGGSLPLWAATTRLAIWAILGLSSILGLCCLPAIKRLSPAGRIAAGGLLAVILLFLISVLGTRGGYQFSRILLYGPLFSIPAALILLRGFSVPLRRIAFVLMILASLVGLPAFLSSVNTVSTDAIYRSDVAAGSFLEDHSLRKGTALNIFCMSADSSALAKYCAPNSKVTRVPEKLIYTGSEEEVWDGVAELIAGFVNADTGPVLQKLFLVNEKSKVAYQHLLGISADDARWHDIFGKLSEANLVYENGHYTVYATW